MLRTTRRTRAAYGLESGATLVTVVGVLVEVPIMLSLVAWVKRFRPRQSAFSVLFVCVHNSCRSQMAEGWARHLLGVEAWSAGVQDSRPLDPRAVQVLAPRGRVRPRAQRVYRR